MTERDGSGDRKEKPDPNIDLRDPWDGPASENAYPEDMMIEIDGEEVPMNSGARAYNRMAGQVDEAADQPWTPESAGVPEASAETRSDDDEAGDRADEVAE